MKSVPSPPGNGLAKTVATARTIEAKIDFILSFSQSFHWSIYAKTDFETETGLDSFEYETRNRISFSVSALNVYHTLGLLNQGAIRAAFE
jgi:hypothetical protein